MKCEMSSVYTDIKTCLMKWEQQTYYRGEKLKVKYPSHQSCTEILILSIFQSIYPLLLGTNPENL